MATGACGISCDVCRLFVTGVCGTCGAGTSWEASAKLTIQERLFDQPCPILACARMNGIGYCNRDCDAFPCENFRRGPYPFSDGYLAMQERRRNISADSSVLPGASLSVPDEYWERIQGLNRDELVRRALVRSMMDGPGVIVDFLDTEIWVNAAEKKLFRKEGDTWVPVQGYLIRLLTTLYLLQAQEIPLFNDWIGVQQLRNAHFFQGPHELNLSPVLARYGHDPAGFESRCLAMGAVSMPMADFAFRLRPFPRIPLVYLLWTGDEEFGPRLSVLFDRSIERHFAADAVWGLVNLISEILVRGQIR
jgi:hypothetical protein